MNKKTIIYITMLSMLLLYPMASLKASPGYNLSVFSPNNVTYDVDIHFSQVTKNATTGDILDLYEIHIIGKIKLISKRMMLDYIGWGFTVNVTVTENNNGDVRESEYNIPIPPIVAVKENTRFIYPTKLSMDLIQGDFGNASMQDILSRVSTNEPYTEIYVYNPFYIEVPVSIGDSIPYGVWNVTSQSGIIVNGRVTSEETITVNGVSYNTYLVNITKAEIINAVREFMDENISIPSGMRFNLGLYYDKDSGWLTKLNTVGGGEISEDNTTTKVILNGNLDLENAGTIMVQNKSYLDRMFGLPPFTFLALDVLFILAIVIIRIKRS